MKLDKSVYDESLEEILSEVTEKNNIHIKNIGKILSYNGINNVKNINDVTIILKEHGVNILKG